MDTPLEEVDLYASVTLVDRVGTGGCEFVFDGKRFTFAPGETRKAVPRFVAEWLFRVDQTWVHTDQGFVSRYGIADGTNDLIEAIGVEAFELSPLRLLTGRVEGWNAEEQDPDRASAKTITAKDDPRLASAASGQRERQGGTSLTFAGRK